MKDDTTQFSFSNSVYAFDSITIDLCLGVVGEKYGWGLGNSAYEATQAKIPYYGKYAP